MYLVDLVILPSEGPSATKKRTPGGALRKEVRPNEINPLRDL